MSFNKLAILIFLGSKLNVSAEDVTFKSLLSQLIDREQLTIHPDDQGVDFTLHQASSYDPRTSNLGDQTLGQPASFSNLDFSQYLRTENNGNGSDEYVMMENFGPGSLVHIWLTGGNYGILRIYLDGSSTPAYQGKANDIIGIAGSTFGTPLSFRSRTNSENTGNNLKAPIPYSTSCKITYDRFPTPTPGSVNNLWYNVNYFKFPAGTSVETYSETVRAAAQTELNSINSSLNSPTTVSGSINTQHSDDVTLQSSGGTSSYSLPSGNNAIRRVQIKLTAGDLSEALKNTWIECTFDDETTVSSPIGHFFGTGDIGIQALDADGWSDWFRTVLPDGTLECRWVMPYKNTASVKLINKDTTQSVSAHLEVDSGVRPWTSGSMLFHADYQNEFSLKSRGPINDYSGNGTGDYNYTYIRGKGVYVGDVLTIDHQSSSGNKWWGEGDEKIYVDGETFPSFIGTGTEDYYCYAFGHAELYANPWVTQPHAGGNGGPGSIINSRVRLLDVHPFQSSYRFDMEIWSWQSTEMDFRSVAYWYGIPGAVSMNMISDAETDFTTESSFSTLYSLEGTPATAVTNVNGDSKNSVAPQLTSSGSPSYDATTQATYGGQSSVKFDGSNYLNSGTVPTTLTDNFGLEAWVYPTALDSFNFVASNGNTNNAGWGIMAQDGVWKIAHMGRHITSTSASVVINTWTHLALIRNAGVSTLYVNGVAQAQTQSNAPAAPGNSFTVGANQLNSSTFEGHFKGFIDYVRVFSFKQNEFDANSDLSYSMITPGKSALYAMDGNSASSITSQSGDGINVTAATLAATGSPQYSTEVPSNNGGSYSAEFDGSSYLNSNTAPISATNNFGVEAWVRPTAQDSLNFVASNGSSDNKGWGIAMQNGSWTIAHMGSTLLETSAAVSLNQWTHVALLRDSGVSTLYVNGVAQSETVASAPLAPSNSFTVGANQTSAGSFEGHFSGNIDYVRAFTFTPSEFSVGTHLSFLSTKAHQNNDASFPHDGDIASANNHLGQWSYHSSSHSNPYTVGAVLSSLTYGAVGDSGSNGFGGGQSLGSNISTNLPAVSGGYIFSDGNANIPIQGQPGYHELEIHPGEGAVGDSANPPFAVARWTASAEDDGTIAILGSIRNLVNSGDGISFAIYYNAIQVFSSAASGSVLAETPFDLNQVVSPGDTIDFVIGNNGNSYAAGDEAALRAQILVPRGAYDPDNDTLESWFETVLGTNPQIKDSDGDNQSDGVEYIAGVDPLDASSSFIVNSINQSAAGNALTWPFKTGNTYTVERSSTLLSDSWTTIATGIDTANWTDVSTEAKTADRFFYRVLIE